MSNELKPLTDSEVDYLLNVYIPGGYTVRDWFLPHENERALDNVRDVIRSIVAAAKVHNTPDVQSAIDAALESVAQALENGRFLHEYSPPAMLAKEAAQVIRAKFGTNPLADEQTEIARLTAALKRANENAERFEREWYLRGHELEDAQERIAELEQELRRAIDRTPLQLPGTPDIGDSTR